MDNDMAHYIDTDRLRKEVKRLERAAHRSALDCADSETRKFHEGKALAYQFVGMLIDSLQQEQKPKQEWSEEDTEMYINVASSLRGYACGLENEEHKKHIKKGLDWLENRFKSLCPQPKEEWSKEDEKNLELIIDCIYTFYPDPVMKYKLKDWLKSLRPQSKIHYWTEEEIEPIISDYLTGKEHYGGMIARLRCLKPKSSWKPSEEQLEAARYASTSLRI